MRILKKDTPERFILLFSPKKLVRLFILKQVKPSSDGKMIKLFTFDDLFPAAEPIRTRGIIVNYTFKKVKTCPVNGPVLLQYLKTIFRL